MGLLFICFFVLHIPLKVSVNVCVGDGDVSFLTLSREAPGSPPALHYTKFSHRVQEGLLLFPSLWNLNTSTIQRLSGNFFLCYMAKSVLTNKETNPIPTHKWMHPYNIVVLGIIWEHSKS